MGLGWNQHKVERAKGVDTARGGERVWKGSCLFFQAQFGCGANSSGPSQIMSASTALPMAHPWGLLSQYSDAALSHMI